MVKNTNGGNKSKGLARKHNNNNNHQERSLRLSTSDLEIFGVVTKILGNGMFYVDSEKHTQLIGHIRNKFRGRSKRDNSIIIGGIVLIGLRDWEFPNFKNCDLLEVYDINDINALNKLVDLPCISNNQYIYDSDFDFDNNNNNNTELVHYDNNHDHINDINDINDDKDTAIVDADHI